VTLFATFFAGYGICQAGKEAAPNFWAGVLLCGGLARALGGLLLHPSTAGAFLSERPLRANGRFMFQGRCGAKAKLFTKG